jgi:hypothetical protein
MAEENEVPNGSIDPFPIPQPAPTPVPAWKQAVLDAIGSDAYAATKTALGRAMSGVATEAPMSPLLVQLSSVLSVMYNLETEANR